MEDVAFYDALDLFLDFFASLGMPTDIKSLLGRPLEASELCELADKCSRGGTRQVSKLKPLGREDLLRIYTAANQ